MVNRCFDMNIFDAMKQIKRGKKVYRLLMGEKLYLYNEVGDEISTVMDGGPCAVDMCDIKSKMWKVEE